MHIFHICIPSFLDSTPRFNHFCIFLCVCIDLGLIHFSHLLWPLLLYYCRIFSAYLGQSWWKSLKIKVVMLLESQSHHKSRIPWFLQYFCPFICNFPWDLDVEVLPRGIHWDWPLLFNAKCFYCPWSILKSSRMCPCCSS